MERGRAASDCPGKLEGAEEQQCSPGKEVQADGKVGEHRRRVVQSGQRLVPPSRRAGRRQAAEEDEDVGAEDGTAGPAGSNQQPPAPAEHRRELGSSLLPEIDLRVRCHAIPRTGIT